MENDILRPIGQRISEVRRSHKVTQEALADRLGVSPKHISHTECGTSSLSLKNLIEFCSLFDCSLDYIIFGKAADSALAKLPDEISAILHTGTEKQIDRLNRYLQVYVELMKGTDNF